MSDPSNHFERPSLNRITPPIIGGTEQKDLPTQNQDIQKTEQHTGIFHRAWESTLGRVGIFAGGTAVAAGLAFGAVEIGSATPTGSEHHAVATAPANTAEATPEATNTPETTPSATPTTPETTGIPGYKYGLTQADVEPLLAKDVYGLNESTTEDKAKLAMFYAQDLPAFADDWRSVSKNPGDALPSELSAVNTPEEVLSFISMAHRQAMTLNNPSDRSFNKALSDKLLAASFINGTLSPAFQSLTAFGAQLDNGQPTPNDRTMPASNYLQLPTINKASAEYTDAVGRSCYDMNTTQALNNGTSVTGDSAVCLVKNANGQILMER